MNNFKSLLWACLLVVLLAPCAQADHVKIVAVNDTHSQIDPAPDGKGGVLRRRAIYDKIRKENKNCVVVHAGDAVQGSNYFSLYGGRVEFPLIDSLKYDMVIFGNHEFDNGIDSLSTFYNNLKAVKLSANYDVSASRVQGVQPYLVKAFGDKRVGFFGISVNPVGMVAEGNFKGLRYLDAMQVADATAQYLKEVQKVDYAVMISHIGYNSMDPKEPNDSLIVAHSHYIDMVIGGHSHTVIEPGSMYSQVRNADGKIVTIGQNGKSGKLVGVYDLDLETGAVDYKHIVVDASWDEAAQAYTALNEWLNGYRKEVVRLETAPVATSTRFMKNNSDAMMNWLTDAVMNIMPTLYTGKIDCCIMNKGGIRIDMPQGSITEGTIRSMFPFDNRFVVLELTGQDLLDALKVMAYRDGDAVSKQLQVKYNSKKEIVSAKLNGKDIKPAQTYAVATINFLANGGDYMVSFKNGKRVYIDNQKYGNHMLNYVKLLQSQGKRIEAKSDKRMRLQ